MTWTSLTRSQLPAHALAGGIFALMKNGLGRLTGGPGAPDHTTGINVVPTVKARLSIKPLTCVGTAGFEPATP